MQRRNWVLGGLLAMSLMLVSPVICRAQVGDANCHGQTVSALANKYGTLDAAASALGFQTVHALQEASREACTSIDFSGGFVDPTNISLNNGAAISGTSLVLTDGGGGEARSAFFRVPVDIQSFTNDFTFLLTNPSADGFTFAIYTGASPTAVGFPGANLGYGPPAGGIPNSVAVKFDFFNNAGEGNDSTGLYQDGQTPTLPAIDLSGTGIDLHSQHVFHVHMTYDGASLSVTITDTVTHASATQVYAVDIPQIVGSTAAFVGFTAATGGETSTQEILTWNFIPGA